MPANTPNGLEKDRSFGGCVASCLVCIVALTLISQSDPRKVGHGRRLYDKALVLADELINKGVEAGE